MMGKCPHKHKHFCTIVSVIIFIFLHLNTFIFVVVVVDNADNFGPPGEFSFFDFGHRLKFN